MKKRGVILLNLGTPEAPEAPQVRKYLKEFLMDPYVIDIPYPLRWFLVNALILPRRAESSAALYRKVWTDRGSPLLVHLLDLVTAVQTRLGPEKWLVQPAMRYGSPNIEKAIRALLAEKVTDVVVVPLYPQYSLAATESSIQECRRIAGKIAPDLNLKFIPPFYQHPRLGEAYAAVAKPVLKAHPYDHVLMSFHGLPERQVKKTDPSGKHCLASPGCCSVQVPANRDCYRNQCYQAARDIAGKLGLRSDQYTVCFQSRLGTTPWIKPYTDEFYRELPKKGIKRLAVLTPAFVADCLETLEEVQIRGKEEFLQNGGEDLWLVPSLNTSPLWVEVLVDLVVGEQ